MFMSVIGFHASRNFSVRTQKLNRHEQNVYEQPQIKE